MLSTLCIVCWTTYLYQYRPSSSYADLPNLEMPSTVSAYKKLGSK